VQTTEQQVFVFEFKSAYENLHLFYPSVADSSSLSASLKTFGDSLQDQHYCLPHEEIVEYSKVPKPVALALKMLTTAISVNPVIAAHYLIGVHPSLIDRTKEIESGDPIFQPNVDISTSLAASAQSPAKIDNRDQSLPQIDMKKSNAKAMKSSVAYRVANAPMKVPSSEWISEHEITLLKRQANEGEWTHWKRTSTSSREETLLRALKTSRPENDIIKLPSPGKTFEPSLASHLVEKPPVVMGYSDGTISRPGSSDGNRTRKNSALSSDAPLTRESSKSDLASKSGLTTSGGTSTPTGELSAKPLSRSLSKKTLVHQPSMDDMVSASLAHEERQNERKLLTLNKSKRNIFDDSAVGSGGSPKASSFNRKAFPATSVSRTGNGAAPNDLTGYLELLENQEERQSKEHSRVKQKSAAHTEPSSEVGGIFLGGILLLDWLESRADPIFDDAFIILLSDSWISLRSDEEAALEKNHHSSPSRPLNSSTSTTTLPLIATEITSGSSHDSAVTSMAKKLRSPFSPPSASKEFTIRSVRHERGVSTQSIFDDVQPLSIEFLDTVLRKHISK
jgi:hypothetical protein